jgi:surface protein
MLELNHDNLTVLLIGKSEHPHTEFQQEKVLTRVTMSMDEAKRRRLNAVLVIDWHSLPEELFPSILSHLDVKTLIEKKRVCSTWRHTCTEAIDAQQIPTTRKVFSTSVELRQAVKKYCGYDAEEILQTYGYPINKWDVSNLQNFSGIFRDANTFDEDISSWNVSNATYMGGMFRGAEVFNQDLSSWNVQNVTEMSEMFHGARAFNGNICSWDVSNVTDMCRMFCFAEAF